MRLTEAVARELAAGPPRTVRDAATPGLMLIVNKRSASWAFQRDLWRGRRLIKTCRVTLGRVGAVSLKDARRLAGEARAQIDRGEDPNASRRAGTTLREALGSYIAQMERRGRSQRSIEGVRYAVERYLSKLLPVTLRELGENPRDIRQLHTDITRRHGMYSANHAMRALRSVYNFELRVDYDLPPNPVSRAVEFNRERRRQAPFGSEGLPNWWAATEACSPVRRAFHRTGLLTGSRPGALAVARRADVDLDRAVLHVPSPKGGGDRAFDIPLSEYLVQVMRELLALPEETWLFPSPMSKSGHIAEWKEDGLATGHALRHVYRTLAQEAGVSELDVKLLLNHSLGGDVTSRYLTRDALLGHLREQQERVTQLVLARVQPDTT